LAKPEDQEVTSAHKKQWSIISFPDYKSFKGNEEEAKTLIPTNTTRTC
jgi:hypothetical protein